ncbi:serine hydrolase domain-containing protein [Cryptosporangium sp. NPDC048952]|uniref:serine hydrolase domain-containing protein n=1 Tax=Cryptosporangium sp. NPDC048952 TaxID=3363961 RepID=UPI00371A54D2
MKRIFLFSTVMVTLVGLAAAPAQAGSRLQDDADALVAQGAPAVIAEVVTPDGSTTVRAGDVPEHAKFRVGSTTKTFVAATTLQLVGEGRIALDAPIEKYLPGVVKNGRNITVRHLLQQTSGLPDYVQYVAAPALLRSEEAFRANGAKQQTSAQLVAQAQTHAPEFAPGARWQYSSTNYLLAGMLIERVTGHRWETEVSRRILRPLGLRDTSAPRTSLDVPEPHAPGYHRFPAPGTTPDEGKLGEPVDTTRMSPTWFASAGSMISTTSDVNRFLSALLDGRVLRPAQLVEMKKTVPEPTSSSSKRVWRYGLGLEWSESPCGGVWSHSGDVPGYSIRNGINERGTRSVVVSITTDTLGSEDAANALIDHALCG